MHVRIFGRRATCFLFIMMMSQALIAQPGTTDSSFYDNGILKNLPATGLMIKQPDGKIIIGGDNKLGRYQEMGIPDSTFGVNGFININPVNGNAVTIKLITAQVNAKITILTSFFDTSYHFMLARYLSDGKLDGSLNGSGKIVLDISPDAVGINTFCTQNDGKIILAGTKYNPSVLDNHILDSFCVMRLSADGNLDHSFGLNGMSTHFGDGTAVNDIALQEDDKIIAVGASKGYTEYGEIIDSLILARYNLDGSLDKSFNKNGKISWTDGSYTGASGNKILLQKDGKIIVGGTYYYRQSHGHWVGGYFTLWRFNLNGLFDSSFNGIGERPINNFVALETVGSLLPQSDGKYILVGNSEDWSSERVSIAMTRMNNDGTVDESFGILGKVLAHFPDSSGYGFYAYGGDAILKGNRIYIAGGFQITNVNNAIFAFKNDGIPLNPVSRNICSTSAVIISDIEGASYQWQESKDSMTFTDINDNSYYNGTSTGSLSLNNVPASWSGYQYRCIVGTTMSNTTTVYFLSENENQWTGTVSDQWEDPANWACKEVPKSNTKVIISSGNVVIHSNVNISDLRIQSGAALTINYGFNLAVSKKEARLH